MFTATGTDGETKPFVCGCCDAPFKKAYEECLRCMKTGRLEFRPLAVAGALDE